MFPKSVRVVLVIWLVFSGCDWGGDYDYVRNLYSQGKEVVCFGDSLTEGVGAREGEDYPSVLARQLKPPIINAGIRGDTTADGLSRLDQDVLRRDPRLVIVLFGGNDFLRRVPLKETAESLEQIVLRIQEGGAMVALVGLRLGLFTDEYGPIYKKIANQHGALLIPDVLDGVLSDPKLKSDSIHPNGDGYRIMAERILKKVRPLLQEASRKNA
jgi:acyl-CoA thioesterase-1